MKKVLICSTLIAATVLTVASCSRRNVQETSIAEEDILAPLPAPETVSVAAPAIPVIEPNYPTSIPVIQQPAAILPAPQPLPAPTSDCDRVPMSKEGLVLFRRNCL